MNLDAKNLTKYSVGTSIALAIYTFLIGWSFGAFGNVLRVYIVFSVILLWLVYIKAEISAKSKSLRNVFIIALMFLTVATYMTVIAKLGFLDAFTGATYLPQKLDADGYFGRLLYLGTVTFQTAVIPLNSTPMLVAGLSIFSRNETYILATAGLILGSIIAYFIGKFLLRPILNKLFNASGLSDTVRKSLAKYTVVLFFLSVFPLFPDSLSSMFAGAMLIPFPLFLLLNVLCRPIRSAITVFTASGRGIGGVTFWAILFSLIIVAVFFYCLKNARKIEKRIAQSVANLANRATPPTIADRDWEYIEDPANHKKPENIVPSVLRAGDGTDPDVDLKVPEHPEADQIIRTKHKDININF